MRFLAVCMLFCLPLSLQSSGPVIRLPVPTYMPTTLGDQWVLRFYRDGSKPKDNTYTVTNVQHLGDGSRIVTASCKYLFTSPFRVVGEPEPQEEVVEYWYRHRVSSEGLYLVEDYDLVEKKWVKIDPPQLSYKHPLVPGEIRWFGNKELNGCSVTDKPEKVKVLAGTFVATPIHAATWQKSLYHQPNIKRTSWVVPGIGNVKSMINGELRMELVTFTPAKKK